jgi:hypothetical protein
VLILRDVRLRVAAGMTGEWEDFQPLLVKSDSKTLDLSGAFVSFGVAMSSVSHTLARPLLPASSVALP